MGLLEYFSAGAKRYGEPLLAIGSGVVAEPLAGWYGLLGGGGDGVRAAREAMTYTPRTQAGRQALQELDGLVEGIKTEMVDKNPPVKLAVDTYNRVADAAGERSPLLGAMVRTAPAALTMLAAPCGGALCPRAG